MSQTPTSPGLGTLAIIPLEIRDRIYGELLYLGGGQVPEDRRGGANVCGPWSHTPVCDDPNCTCYKEEPILHKLGILFVSKAVYAEARPVLFQVNEWKIAVDQDWPIRGLSCVVSNLNASIMGLPGWEFEFSHSPLNATRSAVFSKTQLAAVDRDNMWAALRYVQVNIGSGRGLSGGGVREYDLLPHKRQTKAGPERPSFVPLLKVLGDVCELLKRSRQLHLLRLTLRSVDKIPGSIELGLDPFRQLRGVRKTSAVCMGMQDDMWCDWNMKDSYGRYLNKILSMPKGTTAPGYVGDEKEPNQNEKEIFDMMGARWMGGGTFAWPQEDADLAGDDSDEIDDFADFLDHLGFEPPPWMMSDDEWESDHDEEDEDEMDDLNGNESLGIADPTNLPEMAELD